MKPTIRKRGTGKTSGGAQGGFRFIPAVALCAAWWAYRERRIRLVDLRTFFACHEQVARRCRLEPGQGPRYTTEEIHRLIGGVGGEHVRASLRRLERAGLLTWSEGAVNFHADPDGPCDDPAGFAAMLELVKNHRRQVPVPRRTLRLLAGGASKAVVATVLGYLLRCLYYRGGRLEPVGTCKASWITSAFGVSERNVRAAKKGLVSLGWLLPLESQAWHRNRWGALASINLAWPGAARTQGLRQPGPRAKAPRQELSTTESSPPSELSTSGSSPLYKNKKLLTEYRNQKPAGGGPTGAKKQGEGEGRPTLRHLVPEDLRDTGRLLELFRQAARAGLLRPSAADRLRFLAAAEHARLVGSKSPCGLFAHLVRHRLWHFATQADEDAALARLKRYRESHRRAEGPKVGIGPGVSTTARAGCLARKFLEELRPGLG